MGIGIGSIVAAWMKRDGMHMALLFEADPSTRNDACYMTESGVDREFASGNMRRSSKEGT